MEHLSVAQAQQCILQYANKQGVETVGLEQSLGRVLALDVRANRDQPPYDVSAMDGYALRSADLAQIPATLEIIEDIKAGDMPTKVVGAGQCARIMTGAPVPQGADAVIRVEDTQAISESNAQINRTVKPGNDIRRLGENMRSGEIVLAAGTEITPGVIGILATVKCAQLQVYSCPRVAILSTGNELEGMDEPVDPNRIPDSNSYALMAQLQALGIAPAMLGIARDDPAELAEYLQRGLEFDVVLVSGGSSVGVHDFVRPTVEALGVQMKFWRVAMKPGHPLAFGVLQRSGDITSTGLFFGLPGNPVSSMVCFEEFVTPLLRRMMGHARLYRRTVQARLGHDVKHQPGRTEFVRVMLKHEQGNYLASSTGTQSSGVSLSMARADGLVVVPAESKGMTKGEPVTVQLLDGTVFQDDVGFGE